MCTRVLASFVSEEIQRLFVEAAAIGSHLDAQAQSFFRNYGLALDLTHEFTDAVSYFHLEKISSADTHLLRSRGVVKTT